MTEKVTIIAEAGVNHNGDLNLAKDLITAAAKAKADYVKFQTFKAEKLVTKNAKKASYQQTNTDCEESQFAMIKKLELDYDAHQILRDHCIKEDIKFLSTAFDLESVDLLVEIGMDLFKIPSGEITNFPLLVKIAKTGLPIILSTGMSNMLEIKSAVDVLIKSGLDPLQLTLLHCNTQYPTPMCDVNLRAMDTMKKEFQVPVGYSDHTLGIEIPIAAVARGALVIEKHFTLDKYMSGPDHAASLDPNELANMVRGIRNIELALGDGSKRASKSELENINVARKSIVANCDIAKGERFTETNLTVKRPGGGISPMRWQTLLNSKAQKNFVADEQITLS